MFLRTSFEYLRNLSLRTQNVDGANTTLKNIAVGFAAGLFNRPRSVTLQYKWTFIAQNCCRHCPLKRRSALVQAHINLVESDRVEPN